MNSSEIRAKYLEFFQNREHVVIPSAPLIPQNDPTTLFTGSGMQPLVPFLLGQKHPQGTRLTNSQKSFRAEDIDEVGDNRHTTFFEMLGNWSLGDYFKREQLFWIFTFLTQEVGLDPYKLYVTVYAGDESLGVPRDDEAVELWQEIFSSVSMEAQFVELGTEENGARLGMQGGRIFAYGDKNWWSRAGAPSKMPDGEPGGPDSEIFYDFGTEHDPVFGEHCHPNCDCGRFLEIGNSVFMEYIKRDGKFEKLAQKNVDFGGGLERITAASNDNPDVFRIDTLGAVIETLEEASGTSYDDPQHTAAFRVVADHMRAAMFIIGDGVGPSNTEQGYFVRRLIRRAVRYADTLGFPAGKLSELTLVVTDSYKDQYPELAENSGVIAGAIADEEAKFRETLSRGLKEFEKLAKGDVISGTDAFVLFSTYGFPFELTEELAAERGATVDREGFAREMETHRATSRAGAEKRFKGGLADTSEETTRLHTAHHLLLKALQLVLGDHVHQRGSNITAERLRIDFSHPEKLTDEQKERIEGIVNEMIDAKLPVIRSVMKREDAETLNAEHEFGAKYPDEVSVYSIGPDGATEQNPQFDEAYSIEFCGGPHVTNTGELAKSGRFKIKKEEAVAAGVRRIKAVLQ